MGLMLGVEARVNKVKLSHRLGWVIMARAIESSSQIKLYNIPSILIRYKRFQYPGLPPN